MADLYTLDDAGLEVADWSTIQASTLADYKKAPEEGGFGPGADVTPNSSFYKVSSPISRQTASVLQALRDLSAQFDPQTAFGIQLDRLGSIIGLKRRGATRSTIVGRAIGTPGTVTTAGALLRLKATSSRWQLAGTGPIIIGANGRVDVTLFASDFGPVDAPAAPSSAWDILTGKVLGWDAFESTDSAQLGRLRETDVEYRARFFEAAAGLCTYEAIVNALRAVTNVSSVYLYVNTSLLFSVPLQLDGKQMRAVVEGGLKDAIILALHKSLGAPVDTAGAVLGEVNPGNGQVLEYRYDRLKRRRCYLRLTITGGNPNSALPVNAAALALQAVDGVSSPVGPFLPYIYGQAAVAAIMQAAPGSVTKLVAEGRLDPGDPWVEDAIVLGIAEYADVSIAPTAATLTSDYNFPPVVLNGQTFRIAVDGGGVQEVVFTPMAGFADVAAYLLANLTGVSVDVVNSRIVIASLTTGGSSELELDGGSVTGLLFDDPNQSVSGSDADVTIVLVP